MDGSIVNPLLCEKYGFIRLAILYSTPKTHCFVKTMALSHWLNCILHQKPLFHENNGLVWLKTAAPDSSLPIISKSNYNGTIHVWLDLTHTAEPDSYVWLESDPAFHELVPMWMAPMKWESLTTEPFDTRTRNFTWKSTISRSSLIVKVTRSGNVIFRKF